MPATASSPGYVYEVDVSALATRPLVVDPVAALAANPSAVVVHQHDGTGSLMAEIASGKGRFSSSHQSGGGMRAPSVSPELRALIFSIRDAEILIQSNVLPQTVVRRHNVF